MHTYKHTYSHKFTVMRGLVCHEILNYISVCLDAKTCKASLGSHRWSSSCYIQAFESFVSYRETVNCGTMSFLQKRDNKLFLV
jgi:hypothetical protein